MADNKTRLRFRTGHDQGLFKGDFIDTWLKQGAAQGRNGDLYMARRKTYLGPFKEAAQGRYGDLYVV